MDFVQLIFISVLIGVLILAIGFIYIKSKENMALTGGIAEGRKNIIYIIIAAALLNLISLVKEFTI